MAKFEHGSITVADSYAETLLSLALAQDTGIANEVFAEFTDFVGFMKKEPMFGDFIVSPAVDPDNRQATLEKNFRGKISDILLNTLLVINRKGRSELVPLIYEQYRLALEEHNNEVDVDVTSAVDLTDELRDKIKEAAAKISGRTARLREKIDPTILGGLVVQIEDQKLDSSVLRQLKQLSATLTERASQEIHSGERVF